MGAKGCPSWSVGRRSTSTPLSRDGASPGFRRTPSFGPPTRRTSPRRITRALEVHRATGRPMSEVEGKGPRPFRTLELGLTMPRERLHRAVDNRVDDQIRRGLIEEVRGLLESGVPPDAPAMSSLGYRQLFPYLNGTEDLDTAVRRIKTDTHGYVRHQETWLRRNSHLVPIDVTESGWQERVFILVAAFLRTA